MERETSVAKRTTLILTGLSGSGKTSIIDAAVKLGSYYGISICAVPKYTTRPPRPTGTATYHHVAPEVFEGMRKQGVFALVHSHASHLYGVRREDLKLKNGVFTLPPSFVGDALSLPELSNAQVVGVEVDIKYIKRRLNERVWNDEEDLSRRLESIEGEQTRFEALSSCFGYLLYNQDPVLEEDLVIGYPAWYKSQVHRKVRDVAERLLSILAWERARYSASTKGKDYVSWLAGAIIRRNTDTNPDATIPRSTRHLKIKNEHVLRYVRNDPLEAARIMSFLPVNVNRVFKLENRTGIELSRHPAPSGDCLEKELLLGMLLTAYAPHFRIIKRDIDSYLCARIDDKVSRPELVIKWP